jgi:hypothetical protein
MTKTHLCKKYCLVPFTSLLTIGLVSYISHTYLWLYAPFLESNVQGIFFVPFPILIFGALAQILCGDPGRVTKQMVRKLYQQN